MAEQFCPIVGKIMFDTPQKAARAQAAMRKRGAPQVNCVSYRCEHCGRFHLGRPGSGSKVANRIRRIERSWGVHS